MQPQVSVIVVNYNGAKDTLECLESLRKVEYDNYNVILVDNGSKDTEYLKEVGNVIILKCKDNVGFTGGYNYGMIVAYHMGSEYVCLLNNDTVVRPDFIMSTINKMRAWQAGIAGVKILDYKSVIDEHSLHLVQPMFGSVNMFTGNPGFKPKISVLDYGQYNYLDTVDWVTGCCMFIHRSVIKDVGYLRQDFFAYYEDVEYCYSARQRGFKVILNPATWIWHKGGKSTSCGMKAYYMTRNRILFMKQHASMIQWIAFLIYYQVFYFWASMIFHNKNWKCVWRGAMSGFNG